MRTVFVFPLSNPEPAAFPRLPGRPRTGNRGQTRHGRGVGGADSPSHRRGWGRPARQSPWPLRGHSPEVPETTCFLAEPKTRLPDPAPAPVPACAACGRPGRPGVSWTALVWKLRPEMREASPAVSPVQHLQPGPAQQPEAGPPREELEPAWHRARFQGVRGMAGECPVQTGWS